MSTFWNDYPEIKEKLIYVKNNMLEKSKSSEKYLDRSFEYLYSTGGKMLRPAFLIIGSLFIKEKLDEKKEKLIKDLASAIEMLHNATLVHDDIIDDSFLRRGKEAIHSKYSKEYAVYMGDYLFSESFLMLSNYDIPRDIIKHLAQGISTVCKAEMLQNHYRYDSKVSVEDYLKVISGKTAALFGISLSVGANQAGIDEDKTNKLYEIGNNIGIAFQITDDILDFTSNEQTLGKEVKSDIIKGYYTLPLLLAFQSNYKKAVKKEGYNFEHHNAMVKYNLSTTQAKLVIFTMLSIAILTGFSLFLLTDWFVLLIGIISFMTGILYSFGPIPISRMPLGEIFSGFFMGFVIFFLTVYINIFNTEIISISNEGFNIYLFINLKEFLVLFFVSFPLVITIANIMLANNTSDLEDDVVNNRFTLPYYLGKENALNLFKWMYYIAFIDIVILIILGILPLISLLILAVFIPVQKNIKKFKEKQTKKDTFVVSVQNHFLISFSFIATLLIQILFF
jgi:heptaprenyl diphosphate synthase